MRVKAFMTVIGLVERKQPNLVKKAGTVDEQPDRRSPGAQLSDGARAPGRFPRGRALSLGGLGSFRCTHVRVGSGAALDGASWEKLSKERQRLNRIHRSWKASRGSRTGSQATAADDRANQLTSPPSGAMRGGGRFRVKAGTVGRSPPSAQGSLHLSRGR